MCKELFMIISLMMMVFGFDALGHRLSASPPSSSSVSHYAWTALDDAPAFSQTGDFEIPTLSERLNMRIP